MPVLETIMAANAAYSAIKTCLSNGRETADLISNVGKFLTAEEELKERVNRKRNSPLAAITGGEEGDWEEFQQLEDLREKRRELESWIRLYGKPGQWDRWVQWQVDARKQRAAAKKAAEKRKAEILETVQVIMAIVFGIAGVVTGLYFIGRYMGKW
jgi:hypothetical protein